MSTVSISAPDIAALMRSPHHAENPYPVYRHLHDHGRPYWLPEEHRAGGSGMWLVSGYDDVLRVMRSAGEFSNDIKQLIPEPDWTVFDHMLLYSDPPHHTRLRQLLTAPFATDTVRSMETRLQSLARAQLAECDFEQGTEFVSEFALPFPMRVICDLMGLPPEHSDQLKQWSIELTSGLDSTLDDEARARVPVIMVAMHRYFDDQLRRGGHPPQSIIGLLADGMETGGCSRTEALGQCLLMLIAGHETTVNLLSSGLMLLIENPSECDRLRQDPTLLASAMEEILRVESPLQRATFRVANQPVKIGGQIMDRGERVSAVIGAANRDPARFPDPDRFVVDRKPNRHVAFGAGIHRCLGERLALLEGRIAFSLLLERLGELELSKAPRWQRRTLFRGLDALHVRHRT